MLDFQKELVPSIIKVIKALGGGIKAALKWFFRYLGLESVYRKFNPNDNKIPTGPIWIIGIYFSIFSLSTALYQNRANSIDSRIDVVARFASGGHYRMFFKQLRLSYNRTVPIEPHFGLYTLCSPFQALFGPHVYYPEGQSALRDLLDEVRLDLRKANLIGADLNRLDLSQADFRNAKMTLANLDSSNFLGADFDSAELVGVSAKHSNFSQAYFAESNLSGSSFRESYFLGADFVNATLRAANMSYSYMGGVRCVGTDFAGTDLTGVDFRNADLRGAKNLKYSQLSKAQCLVDAKIDSSLRRELEEKNPDLFDCVLPNHGNKQPAELWGGPLKLLIDLSDNR